MLRTEGEMPQVPFLDLSSQSAEVAEAVLPVWQDLFLRGQFIGGEPVERFEREWAAYCGTAHAVGVANGTDALVLALRATGIGPGDEVIVPTNTFVATAEAVVLAGAVPRFADVSPDTLLLTPETMRAALTPRTRAVLVVHLYGQTPDMDGLAALAESAGIDIIEDAAQAHGASWRGKRAGSFGTAGCFSFYPGKNLGAAGDGGAVVTNDPGIAETVRVLRNHGRSGGSHHAHTLVGTNSRLDTLQAVVLSAKLARLDAWNGARRTFVDTYRRGLEGTSARLVEISPDAVPVHHLAIVRVPNRRLVQQELAARGISTGIHYPVPCHLCPAFSEFSTGPLPTAEDAAEEILSLPLSPHMTTAQVERVCGELREVLLSVEARQLEEVGDVA